jgi:hypothetical protein
VASVASGGGASEGRAAGLLAHRQDERDGDLGAARQHEPPRASAGDRLHAQGGGRPRLRLQVRAVRTLDEADVPPLGVGHQHH